MAAHIFDIDGTLVKWHTNEWLPGAFEMLQNITNRGDQIILITMRGPQDANTAWSVERTKETIIAEMKAANMNPTIIFGVQSPRILHDDNEIKIDKRFTDQTWL